MCKILEFLDQHPQRNNLSKLAFFDPILQRPYSAMAQLMQQNASQLSKPNFKTHSNLTQSNIFLLSELTAAVATLGLG